MQRPIRNVLFTRSIAAEDKLLAASLEIEIQDRPFIAVSLTARKEQLESLLSSDTDGFIFTSANAVRVLIETSNYELLSSTLSSKVTFAVGAETSALLKSIGISANLPAQYTGAGLASQILSQQSINHLVYFCGNIRRPELPDTLRSSGLAVQEEVVYETRKQNQHIDDVGQFDALAFYSPSAVLSFLQQYAIPEQATIFAIGETTRKALTDADCNQVIVPKNPITSELIRTIHSHYQQVIDGK